MKRLGTDRKFNAIGGGLALTSIVLPWYIGEFCGRTFIFWVFGLPQLSWLVVLGAGIGAVLSLFSRYGGMLTLAGSLLFALTFQIPFTRSMGRGNELLPPCPPSGFFGLSQPMALHTFGFWFALAGGILSLLGIS